MSGQTTDGALVERHLGRAERLDRLTEVLSAHVGRFSEGIEQLPENPGKMRQGRFSDGIGRRDDVPGKLHIGRFSQGSEQLPETVTKLRTGSFADGLEKAWKRSRRPEPTRPLRRAA